MILIYCCAIYLRAKVCRHLCQRLLYAQSHITIMMPLEQVRRWPSQHDWLDQNVISASISKNVVVVFRLQIYRIGVKPICTLQYFSFSKAAC